MVKVKICGITNVEDALQAVEAGADALGFIFYKKSPRCITPAKAHEIISSLPPFISTVGVFVDKSQAEVERVIRLTGIDVVQVHGHEPPEACVFSRNTIKAVRVKELEDLDPIRDYSFKVSAFLLDTYSPHVLGGTGVIFNWDIAVEAKAYGRIILAGGLTAENVQDAINRVKPYAVDVCGGVEESKGKKNHRLVTDFIFKAKTAL